MVRKYKLTSTEAKKFYMIMEVKPNQTFFKLHQSLQHEAEFDTDQLAAFFVADREGNVYQEIGLFNPGNDDANFLTMDETKIEDVEIPKGQFLVYVFDLISMRSLTFHFMGTADEDEDYDYPRCTEWHGDIPRQNNAGTKIEDFDTNDEDDIFDSGLAEELPEDL